MKEPVEFTVLKELAVGFGLFAFGLFGFNCEDFGDFSHADPN